MPATAGRSASSQAPAQPGRTSAGTPSTSRVSQGRSPLGTVSVFSWTLPKGPSRTNSIAVRDVQSVPSHWNVPERVVSRSHGPESCIRETDSMVRMCRPLSCRVCPAEMRPARGASHAMRMSDWVPVDTAASTVRLSIRPAWVCRMAWASSPTCRAVVPPSSTRSTGPVRTASKWSPVRFRRVSNWPFTCEPVHRDPGPTDWVPPLHRSNRSSRTRVRSIRQSWVRSNGAGVSAKPPEARAS